MKNLLRKTVASALAFSVLATSTVAFADKSALMKEEAAIQNYTHLSVSKKVADDGRCNGAWTAEGYLMLDFYRSGAKYHATMSGTGGYLQTSLTTDNIMPLVTADLMNAKRGNVASKFDGIRIRNGEKAYRYAMKAYESALPKIRAEVRKSRDANKVYRCPLDKDLSMWNAGSDRAVQNLYKKLAKVYRANSWDEWEKDGTNKKILAYVAIMAVYESSLPEAGEKVRMLRRW